MCFRPSPAVVNTSQIQIASCPSCGQPVAADKKTESGECPYCHNLIPLEINGEGNFLHVASTPVISPFRE